MDQTATGPGHSTCNEAVEIQGHIIDSLLLPKVLDEILARGGDFDLEDIRVGKRPADPSYAQVEVRADTAAALAQILADIHAHGAMPVGRRGRRVVPVGTDGDKADRAV